jgi:hypothetical protein
MRRTVKVVDLVEMVNKMNRESTCGPDLRVGWNSWLEEILLKTKTYSGFQYLWRGRVPMGHLPGIETAPDQTKRFPDPTRREYIVSSILREIERKKKWETKP